jgi:transcriptional regulator with XRE-family HTH domain
MSLIFSKPFDPDSSGNITTDLYRSLKQRCDAAGTNLQEVCDRAGVARSTVQAWRNREPHTIEIIRRMEAAIEEIKNQKNNNA